MIIRALEELTLNAWPPLDVMLFDGWLLSFSDGYTRRANSVHALYPSTLPLADKIATCESAYAARGQPTVFKLTPHAMPSDLDHALEDRGYTSAGTTSVQTADLTSMPSAIDDSVRLSAALEDPWLADFIRLSATPSAFEPTMRKMLTRILPPHAFAEITSDGVTVAQGLATADRGYVGLFDIIVASSARNQGLARRLITRLLQWGRAQSAGEAYLAVLQENAPAQHLYAALGFHERYSYWYRSSPPPPSRHERWP